MSPDPLSPGRDAGQENVGRGRRGLVLRLVPVLVAAPAALGWWLAGERRALVLAVGLPVVLLAAGSALSAVLLADRLLRARSATRAERARRDAEEAARRAHRQFLRRLDHELKNPLTAMRAAANSLDDDGSRAIIDAQSLRMGRLLKNLRRLAELEVAPLEAEQVDLVETARDAVAAVGQDLAVSGQGRSFALSFPEAPWPLPPVRGDADLLYSAVHNMVSNAAKYTGPDALIEVRGSQTGGFVALEVADTGIGIPAEEIDQVWGELSRASNAQGRPGQGLGLALVATIAARHGGSCSLSSRLGVGTSITMSLPADG
ncbi:sensor histidine kinase [Propionibacterium acidifaciens]|uniref:sensor histidine kinase n=1 Tax=Propionibacterium acidifaciens TaxID=556499 RepID=UPI0023F17C44|nr:HAMP domain-containing sensor histidine kinase [Propionibacterium acidifaciens]